MSARAAPLTVAGASQAAFQGALPPLRAPPWSPLHGWAVRGTGPRCSQDWLRAQALPLARAGIRNTPPGRAPAPHGRRRRLDPGFPAAAGNERGERERRSERGSCSNPIPGAAAAAAAVAASATAGEVT